MIKGINLFLSFNGNCKEALQFYKDTFNAEIIECTTYEEAEMSSSDKDKELIMNSNIVISNLQISCTDNLSNDTNSGNQIALWLEIETESDFNTIYTKFDNYITEKEETFWNSIYAKVQDKFGIVWELNYQK